MLVCAVVSSRRRWSVPRPGSYVCRGGQTKTRRRLPTLLIIRDDRKAFIISPRPPPPAESADIFPYLLLLPSVLSPARCCHLRETPPLSRETAPPGSVSTVNDNTERRFCLSDFLFRLGYERGGPLPPPFLKRTLYLHICHCFSVFLFRRALKLR